MCLSTRICLMAALQRWPVDSYRQRQDAKGWGDTRRCLHAVHAHGKSYRQQQQHACVACRQRLCELALAEVEALQEKPVSLDELETVRTLEQRAHENSLQVSALSALT